MCLLLSEQRAAQNGWQRGDGSPTVRTRNLSGVVGWQIFDRTGLNDIYAFELGEAEGDGAGVRDRSRRTPERELTSAVKEER